MAEKDSDSLGHQEIRLSPLEHFKQSLILLSESRKSLLFMFFINFFQSFQYYLLVTFIPLYFSSEMGYSDLSSGFIFGGFGIMIGLCSLYLSSVLHIISLKRGMIASSMLGILGFFLMIVGNSYINLFSVLTIQAVSCSLSWPYIEYGIKMYSSDEFRNITSSCYFITNYFAGIIAGIVIDGLWGTINGANMFYIILFTIGIVFCIFSIGLTFYLEHVPNPDPEKIIITGGISKKRFLRYCALIFLLILLRSACFGHLDATLPKYMLRTIDENAHFGGMLAVHSITMIVGVFILTPLSYRFSNYDLIVIGGLVGSVASSLLIMSQDLYVITLFVVLISIGESIWVPRLLDYTFQIAPEGEEGIYLALSNCPFYFGMILTGSSSGILLNNFCAESNSQCFLVWTFVFLLSFFIVVLLFSLKQFISEPIIRETDSEICDSKL